MKRHKILSDDELIDVLQISVSKLKEERDVWKRRFHEKRQEHEVSEIKAKNYASISHERRTRAEAAEARIAELERALEFYRDEWQFNAEGDFWMEPTKALFSDEGRIARAVLNKGRLQMKG